MSNNGEDQIIPDFSDMKAPLAIDAFTRRGEIIIDNIVGKNVRTTEETQNFIIIKANNSASKRKANSIEKAVITVPVYFIESKRQPTKDICKIAGVDAI